jgi:hypothetical protein
VSIPVVVQQVQPALFNQTGTPGSAAGTSQAATTVSAANKCTTCRSAFLVSGTNFPDALAAGVRSYSRGIPMILTDPAALSPEARQTLRDLQTQQVYIIGGTAAVSQAVQDELVKATQDGGLGLAVARISGADRLQTAVAIHAWATRLASNTGQDRESHGVRVPCRQLLVRTASTSDACEGDDACSARMTTPRLPGDRCITAVGATWVACELGGLNISEWLQSRNTQPL